MGHVFDLISTYGYGMIFLLLTAGIVGLPVPDETLLISCGYLISQGKMHPAAAFFSALAGSWCGISISYTIGRTLGVKAVHRYGRYLRVTEERLQGVHRWFDRIGHWALFFGYFVPGVRHFTALVAGMSGLSFPYFIRYAWTGGVVWISTFLTIGYFVGSNWEKIAVSIHIYALYISIALVVGAGVYYLIRRKRGIPFGRK